MTISKPSTLRATNDKEKKRATFKYNPYGVSKSDETKFEGWKEKRRVQK